MKTIHKHTINVEDLNDRLDVEWPALAEPLSVAEQYPGQVAIWYRCGTDQPMMPRTIFVVGTGHPAPDDEDIKFVGTVLLARGQLVFHIFVAEQQWGN